MALNPTINLYQTNHQSPITPATLTESTNLTPLQLEMKIPLTQLPKSFILISHVLEPLTALNLKAHVPTRAF